MKRFGWITALVLVCTVNAVAQPTETLVVPPYPADVAWKQIMDKKNSFMRQIEWIPADQTESDIRDILTQQNFNLKTMPATLFTAGMLQSLSKACEGLRVNGPTSKTENGYSVAYAQAYCTGQKGAGKDVDIFLKAIQGKEGLYVVQREFRRPAEPGAVPGVRSFSGNQAALADQALESQATAAKYLSQVQLCPTPEPCAVPAQ